ncbi:hypothetical protein GCM10009836_16290 [Pseudonocardia ailaonensis]|uniref:Asp23/Gls24 family envelope stress response protein n=1 Tax=Pseudonocardia ailaonensis TaxID=367279 RepID=A0ABN2MVE3_9PSEU
MTTSEPGELLARRLAELVSAHPAVSRLDAGPWNAVATWIPGRRLVGVRVPDEPAAPVEVAVVLGLDRPLPEVVRELRAAIATLTPRPVDLTVADVDAPPQRARPAATAAVEIGP